MSTPIETNTEELQEVLQQVYNLPSRSASGDDSYDLVIGLNVANTRVEDDKGFISLASMTIEDISIESGSVSTVVGKINQGIPVRVALKAIHFYMDLAWFKHMSTATNVALVMHDANGTQYPNTDLYALHCVFFVATMPDAWSGKFGAFSLAFDGATSEPIYCEFTSIV